MKYLLDTHVVSDFVKGHSLVMSRIQQTAPRLIGISSITAMEIEYGLQLNPARVRKLLSILEPLLGTSKNSASTRSARTEYLIKQSHIRFF